MVADIEQDGTDYNSTMDPPRFLMSGLTKQGTIHGNVSDQDNSPFDLIRPSFFSSIERSEKKHLSPAKISISITSLL